MARAIDFWPVEKLIPYANNARTHSEAQVAQVAGSIREFGFTNPILVATNDGIITGHCRLLAARKLGMEQVPVIVLDHLSDAQRRAYIIADNKLALEAGWDNDILAAEFARLREEDFDLDVIGFSAEEMAALDMDAPVESGDDPGECQEDEVPEPPANPATRSGDVWLLGNVHYSCPDCHKRYTPEEAAAMGMDCSCG